MKQAKGMRGRRKRPSVVSWALLTSVSCLLTSSLLASVDGTVINRTTGKPQAGAVVALYKLAQQTGPEEEHLVAGGAERETVVPPPH